LSNPKQHTTDILKRHSQPGHEAAGELLPHIYDELKRVAGAHFRNQAKDHTLQPTALIHEAYVRLVDHEDVGWKGRSHFVAVASKAMRQILIDHHRQKQAEKRGGNWKRWSLSGAELDSNRDVDFGDLEDALVDLKSLDEGQANVVDLRFFGGLKMEEIAHVLGVSMTTVEGDWRHAKAWLRDQLKS
jgi:RNA polymerase sigma-70 factor (ECF subfamily)